MKYITCPGCGRQNIPETEETCPQCGFSLYVPQYPGAATNEPAQPEQMPEYSYQQPKPNYGYNDGYSEQMPEYSFPQQKDVQNEPECVITGGKGKFSLVGIICFVLALPMLGFGGFQIFDFISTKIMFPQIKGFGFLPVAIPLFVVGVGLVVLSRILSKCEITVTNKRITGKLPFKRYIVEIPIESVYMVRAESMKTVSMNTAYGTYNFHGVKNYDQIVQSIFDVSGATQPVTEFPHPAANYPYSQPAMSYPNNKPMMNPGTAVHNLSAKAKKIIIIIVAAVVAIALTISIPLIIKANVLTDNEKTAVLYAERLKSTMKYPESLTFYDDIKYLHYYNENGAERTCYFYYVTAKNGFGMNIRADFVFINGEWYDLNDDKPNKSDYSYIYEYSDALVKYKMVSEVKVMLSLYTSGMSSDNVTVETYNSNKIFKHLS